MKPTAKKKPPAMAAKSADGVRIKNPGKGLEHPESAESSGASEMLLLLDKAIQTTKTGITFCDKDNIIQYTNPADAEMHGYGVAELIGGDVSIFSPSGKKRSMTFEDMKAIRSWARESVNRKKDGTLFPVYLISDVVKNDRGEPIGVVTVCEDITERKRAEEELRIKDTAISSSMSGIALADLSGNLTYANPSILRMWGYSGEAEVLGKNVSLFVADPSEALRIIGVLLKDGGFIGEVVGRRKDGGLFDVQVAAGIVRDSAGGPLCMMGSFLDIRDRKRAEEALRESEEKYRSLFTNEIDAICILDPETGRMIDVNDAALKLYGYQREEVPDIRISDFSMEPKESARAIKTVMEKGSVLIPERLHKKKDGSHIYVEISAGAFMWKGKKLIYAIIRDITERIRLQHEALRAAHLASVGELAAGIAHEINNPANSIINYAQMILDETAPESRQSHIAAEVMHEGERIARIVRNMLSFSRHREEDLSYVSVGYVLADSISLIESQLKKLNAVIDVDIPDGLPEIFLDPHKLHQVFVNILNNAWYALSMKSPDSIRSLSIKAVPIGGGGSVRISFRDSGAGVRPENMDKIFAPFFTTKPSGVGTGLGLSISQSIVKSFGGDIRIRSEEGRFTEVVVELPAGGRG